MIKATARKLKNGKCLACVYPIRHARKQLGRHEGSVGDARGANQVVIKTANQVISRRYFLTNRGNCGIVVAVPIVDATAPYWQ